MSYPTPAEFFERVCDVARQCGYAVDGPQHPEDIVANLVPVMEAFAAGWGDGFRAGRVR